MQGKCRIGTLLPNLEYIHAKRGEEGVQIVLKGLAEKGYPLDFRDMPAMDWVDIEVRRQFLYAVTESLGWNEEKVRDMGEKAVKLSFIVRNFIGLFMNIKKIFNTAPQMWQKHYSVGTLTTRWYKEGKGSVILKDFDLDPLMCVYLTGYFAGVGKLAEKSLRVEEIKCTFRGDKYHEFLIEWRPR